jgi:hypothetical protein
VSLKTCLGKALVYLVLEIGALSGVPMRPDEIAKIMQVMDRNVAVATRDQSGDGNDDDSAS